MQAIKERRQQSGAALMSRCPISGAKLSATDHTGNFIYMLLQMDAGVGKNLQTGAFRTAAQVLRSSRPPPQTLKRMVILYKRLVVHVADIAVVAQATVTSCTKQHSLSCATHTATRSLCSRSHYDAAAAQWYVIPAELQAHRSWIVKMSEWALEPLAGNVRLGRSSYSLGLNTARAAAHLVVYDRYRQVRPGCLEC